MGFGGGSMIIYWFILGTMIVSGLSTLLTIPTWSTSNSNDIVHLISIPIFIITGIFWLVMTSGLLLKAIEVI